MKKNKLLTYIIIGAIIGFVLIIIIPTIYFKLHIKKINQEKMIRVPYTVVTLDSNSLITAELIDYKNVKETEIQDNVIYDANDIIGKCVKEGIAINENSYIKKNQLEDCKNITN